MYIIFKQREYYILEGLNVMKEELKIFAERLRFLRTEKNMSQKLLAELMDCPKSLISYYENGKREPGYLTIIKLSQIFDEETSYIMGEFPNRRIKKIAQ